MSNCVHGVDHDLDCCYCINGTEPTDSAPTPDSKPDEGLDIPAFLHRENLDKYYERTVVGEINEAAARADADTKRQMNEFADNIDGNHTIEPLYTIEQVIQMITEHSELKIWSSELFWSATPEAVLAILQGKKP